VNEVDPKPIADDRRPLFQGVVRYDPILEELVAGDDDGGDEGERDPGRASPPARSVIRREAAVGVCRVRFDRVQRIASLVFR
jgi:hypothetical protein